MIPPISEILTMLLTGEWDLAKANEWIEKHLELARQSAAAPTRDDFAVLAPAEVPSWFVMAEPDTPEYIRYFAWRWAYADLMLEFRVRPAPRDWYANA